MDNYLFWHRFLETNKIRYANLDDAKILGQIHAQSWKVAYKGIVPDGILNNITSDKRQKFFEKN